MTNKCEPISFSEFAEKVLDKKLYSWQKDILENLQEEIKNNPHTPIMPTTIRMDLARGSSPKRIPLDAPIPRHNGNKTDYIIIDDFLTPTKPSI